MSKYITLKVKEVVKETADAITLHFKQPLFRKIKYKPGQFLTLIVPVNGQSQRRSYSLCSSPSTDDTLAVTVKRVKGGSVSNYLNDNIQEGDKIDLMEPMGSFTPPEAAKNLVLFGAGSGITPLMSVIKTALVADASRQVTLVYANTHENSIIFKKQIAEFESKYSGRFKVLHILSQPQSPNWGNGLRGRLEASRTEEILQHCPDLKNLSNYFMLCGPQGFMVEAENIVRGLGFDNERIIKESFYQENGGAALSSAEIIERTIKVLLGGQTYELAVAPSKSVLDAALDKNLDMPYSCQSGLCTACRGLCKSGKVKMDTSDGLSDKELSEGYVLTCQAHPLTDDVVIDMN